MRPLPASARGTTRSPRPLLRWFEWIDQGYRYGSFTALARYTSGEDLHGGFEIEWWEADRGLVVTRQSIVHAGGQLDLTVPGFARHLAFKR